MTTTPIQDGDKGVKVITIPGAELDEDVVVVIVRRAHYRGTRP